jgi:uncharacterized membrane protein
MTTFLGVPLHPALAHFPIAAALFAAGALAVAVARPASRGTAWRSGGAALALVALVAAVPSILTGHAWADALGRLPPSSWLPSAAVSGGVLRRHALLALGSAAALVLAVPLAVAARHPQRSATPAFLASALAALLLLATGHQGGSMVFRPVPAAAAPSAPATASTAPARHP